MLNALLNKLNEDRGPDNTPDKWEEIVLGSNQMELYHSPDCMCVTATEVGGGRYEFEVLRNEAPMRIEATRKNSNDSEVWKTVNEAADMYGELCPNYAAEELNDSYLAALYVLAIKNRTGSIPTAGDDGALRRQVIAVAEKGGDVVANLNKYFDMRSRRNS